MLAPSLLPRTASLHVPWDPGLGNHVCAHAPLPPRTAKPRGTSAAAGRGQHVTRRATMSNHGRAHTMHFHICTIHFMHFSWCQASRARHLLPCIPCQASRARHHVPGMLPGISCHASAAMHLVPGISCQVCCQASRAMHLLPGICCHASRARHLVPGICRHASRARHLVPGMLPGIACHASRAKHHVPGIWCQASRARHLVQGICCHASRDRQSLHASIDLLGPNRNDRLILVCWGIFNGRSYAPIHMHVILICWDEHTCFALPPLTHPPHPYQYLSHTFHFSLWNTLRPVMPGGHSWLPVAVYRRHSLSTKSKSSSSLYGLQSRQASEG